MGAANLRFRLATDEFGGCSKSRVPFNVTLEAELLTGKCISEPGWTCGTESETCAATSLSHTKRSEAYAKAAPKSHHATQDSLGGLDSALPPALRPICSRVGCRIQCKHADQESRGCHPCRELLVDPRYGHPHWAEYFKHHQFVAVGSCRSHGIFVVGAKVCLTINHFLSVISIV